MKSRNFSANLLAITAHATVNTEFAVVHGLDMIPQGYIVCRRGSNASLYLGSTTWTDTTVYFKSDVASATFFIFLFS